MLRVNERRSISHLRSRSWLDSDISRRLQTIFFLCCNAYLIIIRIAMWNQWNSSWFTNERLRIKIFRIAIKVSEMIIFYCYFLRIFNFLMKIRIKSIWMLINKRVLYNQLRDIKISWWYYYSILFSSQFTLITISFIRWCLWISTVNNLLSRRQNIKITFINRYDFFSRFSNIILYFLMNFLLWSTIIRYYTSFLSLWWAKFLTMNIYMWIMINFSQILIYVNLTWI